MSELSPVELLLGFGSPCSRAVCARSFVNRLRFEFIRDGRDGTLWLSNVNRIRCIPRVKEPVVGSARAPVRLAE